MTNEQFLYILYFGAGGGGLALVVVTAIALARPNRQATDSAVLPQLGKFLRRVFPPWLILTVILAFISVNYMECRSYSEVIGNREYIVDKMQQQVYRMAIGLSIALMTYAVILALYLLACARARRRNNLQNP